MPLRDHFHRPGRSSWRWKSFHAAWATYIAENLNKKPLPPGYLAMPQVQLARQAQVDVAAMHDEEAESLFSSSNGGVAMASVVWAPAKPALVVPTDLADLETLEIQVFNEDEGNRLVAAIELTSSANKDHPAHRRAFVAKCAACLQQDVSVVLVDCVTDRLNNMHAELMDFLELGDEARNVLSSELNAVAYRAVKEEQGTPRLEIWPATLRVGEPLPTLPLWLSYTLAVPLDLEASYTSACESLRMS